MIEYDIDLYKDDEKVYSTKLLVSGQTLDMEEVAKQCHRLLMCSQYDKDFDGFVVYDPSDGPNSQNLYMDLVE